MIGFLRHRVVPRVLVTTLALAACALLAVSPAARAGDGSAMFGLTPTSTAGDDSGTTRSGAACQAKPAPAAPKPTVIVVPSIDLEALEDLADELEAVGVTLAQVAPVPPTPRAAPAPRTRARAVRQADRKGRVTTDTTVVVRPGSRFELHNFGGQVAISTWSKNAVRVQVEHPRRAWAELSQAGGLLRVVSVAQHGPAQTFQYTLTVPQWMPVSLSGVYNDVTANGLEGGIEVETVRGDIVVKRAAGDIVLRSVEGLVDLSDAKGTIKVSSVNDAVRVAKAMGTVQAEAVNGDIQLLNLSSKNVEATTVNGAVFYDGKIADDGSYRFSTHNGDIALGLTENGNATVTVSTYAGEFEAPFPIRLARTKEGGKRFAFAVGNGRAKIDLESFQGAIQLFTPQERPEVFERFRESWRESERERVRESKWIWKGNWDADHEDDEDDEDDEDGTPSMPVHHKGKNK